MQNEINTVKTNILFVLNLRGVFITKHEENAWSNTDLPLNLDR